MQAKWGLAPNATPWKRDIFTYEYHCLGILGLNLYFREKRGKKTDTDVGIKYHFVSL